MLVVNAYSTLNRGDAVILSGLIAALRGAGAKHIAVAVPTGSGEAERRLRLGADEVVPMPVALSAPRVVRRFFPLHALWVCWRLAITTARAMTRPSSVPALRAYQRADLVVSTGGAYLGGPRLGINVLTAYPIMLARMLGRPCVIAPVTIKPMSRLVSAIVSTALRGTTVFGRDAGTVDRLQGLGLDSRLASDIAFRSPVRPRAPHQSASSGAGLVVAVAPRKFGWDAEAFQARADIAAATAQALIRLVRRHGARLLIIPQSNASDLENDLDAVDDLMASLPPDVLGAAERLRPAETIEEALAQYQRADVVYAYRLHAAVLALLAGKPSAVIDYEPKVRGVLGMLQLSDWVVSPEHASDPATVVERLNDLAGENQTERMTAALAIAARMSAPFEQELARRLSPDAAFQAPRG